MEVDRRSGQALYQQVAQQLVTAIADATYPVGSLIPSEAQLASMLHVSRAVIRQAIDQLVRSGIVARVPGKGTFVVSTVAQQRQPLPQSNGPRTGLIGGLVSYLDSARPSELMEALWEIARGRGYDIIVAATENNLTLQEENIRRLIAKGVEGLVIVPVESEVPDSIFLELVQTKFPLCLMDRNVPELGIDAVLTDNEGAGYLATRHLLELGHRRIAILSRPISPVRRARIRGYRRALEEWGISYSPTDVYCMLQLPSITLRSRYERQVQEDIADLCLFLNRPDGPTAVVSLQPATTLELFEALQRMDWRVPEDLSLVVLDSVPIITDRVRLPLTRVDLQQRAIAAEALSRLLDRLNGRRRVTEQTTIPAKLDIQQSAIPLADQVMTSRIAKRSR